MSAAAISNNLAFIDRVFVIFSSSFGYRLQLEHYEKQCPAVMGVWSRLYREVCPSLSWPEKAYAYSVGQTIDPRMLVEA